MLTFATSASTARLRFSVEVVSTRIAVPAAVHDHAAVVHHPAAVGLHVGVHALGQLVDVRRFRRPRSWHQVSRTRTVREQGRWASREPIAGMRDRSFRGRAPRCLTPAVSVPAPATGTAIRWPLLLVLASLAAVAPVATDLYLPGFPAMGDALGARRQRGAAHPHLVPGRARVRPAGDGPALRPLRAPYAARGQRRGLRGRGRGLRDGPDADRARRRPPRAGLRRRRRHGHRPGGDHRRGDRHRRRPGLHADAHRRRGRAGAGAAGRRPAGRPGRLARDALGGRRPLPGDAGRRPRRAPRDAPARAADPRRSLVRSRRSAPCSPTGPTAARWRSSRCRSR